jgi:hypothetical protein
MDAASPLPTSLMKGVLTVPSTDPSDDAKYLQTHFAGNIHFHTVNQNGVDGEDYFSVMMAGDDGGRPVVVVLIRVVRHSLPMLPSIWITETDNDGSLSASASLLTCAENTGTPLAQNTFLLIYWNAKCCCCALHNIYP